MPNPEFFIKKSCYFYFFRCTRVHCAGKPEGEPMSAYIRSAQAWYLHKYLVNLDSGIKVTYNQYKKIWARKIYVFHVFRM